MNKKVIVIGAGLGGLSSAALLAKEGFDVTILEKNSQAGGRAMQLKSENGYTFDIGPSWYLMPEVYENYFAEFNKRPEDFYKLKKLNPSYRVFFDSKKYFDISADIKDVYKLFDKFEKDGGKKLKAYLKVAGKRYDKALEKFLYKDYKSIKDILDLELIKEVLTSGLFASLESHVEDYFESEEARKILLFNIVFLGISPKKAPSLYSMLAYADFVKKVWYPEGGIYSLVQAFEKLCLENGVKIKYNHEVKEINPDMADIIISNADYAFTEMDLLSKKHRSLDKNYWEKKTIAQSAFCIYLGINKRIPKLKHHSLYVGSDWNKNFKQQFESPAWPDSPSYYVCTPSKTDKNVAPSSSENLFILVPIAAGLKDTKKIRKNFSEKIITHLEKLVGQDFRKNIEYKKIITLNDYKSMYNSYKGTAFGLAHTLFQTAIFRPYMKSAKLDNLYYAGQYTHPGVGMPTSVISGQLVAKKIISEHGF